MRKWFEDWLFEVLDEVWKHGCSSVMDDDLLKEDKDIGEFGQQSHMKFFHGQNVENEYINVICKYINVMCKYNDVMLNKSMLCQIKRCYT